MIFCFVVMLTCFFLLAQRTLPLASLRVVHTPNVLPTVARTLRLAFSHPQCEPDLLNDEHKKAPQSFLLSYQFP